MIYRSLEDFDHTFRMHYAWLVRLAWRICRRTEVAEDLVQDVFVRTWESRNEITVSGQLRSYLASAVVKRALSWKAREARIVPTAEPNEISAGQSSDAEDLERRMMRVRREVERLPDRCRLIFALKRDEGLTIQEIADYLEISPKTVENQLVKAMKLLRERLTFIREE